MAESTFGGWLKSQPLEFQDEFFAGKFGKRAGDEAAALFRADKLTLDKFVDPTGRVYTLEQLRGVDRAFSFAE